MSPCFLALVGYLSLALCLIPFSSLCRQRRELHYRLQLVGCSSEHFVQDFEPLCLNCKASTRPQQIDTATRDQKECNILPSHTLCLGKQTVPERLPQACWTIRGWPAGHGTPYHLAASTVHRCGQQAPRAMRRNQTIRTRRTSASKMMRY